MRCCLWNWLQPSNTAEQGGGVNPLQTRIKNLPAMAKIKNYNSELAFVELDACRNRNLEKGMILSIRRDAMLVGKV